jgi:phthiocerol/phenolphthiocerol synthesis type-I polyketide synthase E
VEPAITRQYFELLGGPAQHTLMEVGPGRTLTSLARRHPAHGPADLLLTSLPDAAQDEAEPAHLLDAAGRLWLTGRDLDWDGLNEGERHRRVPLPTYPFQRLRFRVDTDRDVPVAIEPMVPGGADDDEDAADEYVEPRDATQKAVAAAFERILGSARVGVHDSFLSLGGDSLIAARLTAWIRREYGAPVTIREVFKSPTVKALAGLIETLEPVEAPGFPQEADSVR